MRHGRVARQPRAIDEDADVLAQISAVVEHIAAHLWQAGEHVRERVADGRALRLDRLAGHQLAQPAREPDLRHEPPPRQGLPSAAAMAASAASALDPSGPPACAMSGRPPPPLPPSTSAPFFTSSTALKRLIRSSVTPTTIPALPSAAVATIATIPDPTCRFPSSARLRRSLSSIPDTARARSFTPLICRISPASPSAFPPPPMANFFLASERSRSSFLRSSTSVPTRAGISSSGTLSSAAAALTT